MPEIFDQISIEISTVEPQTIYKKDKPYNIYKLPFVNAAIKESEFSSYKLTIEKDIQENLKRLESIKPFLTDMFSAIEKDKDSMQLFAFIDDNRLKYIQIFYDGARKTALVTIYVTHSSLSDQYLKDLALAIDVSQFIQRKTDTFEYGYNLMIAFGAIYKLEKR